VIVRSKVATVLFQAVFMLGCSFVGVAVALPVVAPGTLIKGIYRSSDPALTNGDESSLLLDSTGRIGVASGGLATEGAAAAGKPVRVGGWDGTNVYTFRTDSSGRTVVIGAAADGASSAGNPVGVAYVTSGSLMKRPAVDANGATVTASFISPLDTITRVTPTASNGTTPVTIQAAAGGVRTYVGELLFYNDSAATRTVTVSSSGGTVLAKFRLAADSTGVLGNNGGLYFTSLGEGLTFVLDGGTTGVTVSGAIVVK
jgi:hypothetical protein